MVVSWLRMYCIWEAIFQKPHATPPPFFLLLGLSVPTSLLGQSIPKLINHQNGWEMAAKHAAKRLQSETAVENITAVADKNMTNKTTAARM